MAASDTWARLASQTTAGPAGPNQDGLWVDPLGEWLVVVDGGGPDTAGITAAAWVLAALVAGLVPIADGHEAAVKNLVAGLHARLLAEPLPKGVHVAVLVARRLPGHLQVWHLGNVRAYRSRHGDVTACTADHSLVALLVTSGQVRPEAARLHPAARSLARFVGMTRAMPPDFCEVDLSPGDRMLVATDGVFAPLDDAALAEALAQADPDQVIAALWRPAPDDDRTAVVFDATPHPIARNDRETLLSGLFGIITRTTDPEALLQKILDLALTLTHGDRAFLFIAHGEAGLHCRLQAGDTPDGGTVEVSRSVIDRVLQTGESFCLTDVATDERYREQASIVDLQLQAVLCAPMTVPSATGGTVIGVLYVDRTLPVTGMQDLRQLEILASHAGVVIQNGVQFAIARLENERLRQLNALGRTAAASLDQDAILYDVLASALQIGGGDVALCFRGPGLDYRFGLTAGGIAMPPPTARPEILAQVAGELHAVRWPHRDHVAPWTSAAPTTGSAAVLCVPMFQDGAFAGALYVSGHREAGFSADDEAFLGLLASHAGVYLAKALRFQALEAQVAELTARLDGQG